MRNLVRDAVIAFAVGGLLRRRPCSRSRAWSDDPTQETIRKCRAAGDTVLVSKCRVMCLKRSGGERDLDTEAR